MGLRDLTLGHDTWRAAEDIGDASILDEYVDAIQALPDSESVSANAVKGFRVGPEAVVEDYARIVEIVAHLVQRVDERG